MLFGVVTLDHYHAEHPHTFIPAIVNKAIAEIDARGLDTEGIYVRGRLTLPLPGQTLNLYAQRIPGRTSTINHLVLEIEKDEAKFEFDPAKHDVFSIAGLLKMFLRQLPTALLPFPANE